MSIFDAVDVIDISASRPDCWHPCLPSSRNKSYTISIVAPRTLSRYPNHLHVDTLSPLSRYHLDIISALATSSSFPIHPHHLRVDTLSPLSRCHLNVHLHYRHPFLSCREIISGHGRRSIVPPCSTHGTADGGEGGGRRVFACLPASHRGPLPRRMSNNPQLVQRARTNHKLMLPCQHHTFSTMRV